MQYIRPSTSASAAQWKSSTVGGMFIAGGSCVVDLMSQGVLHPSALIDLNALPQRGITEYENGGLRMGALTTMGELAWHPAVMQRFPVLMQALLSGATPQVHHAATIGGNLMQKTRCTYFRNNGFRCNKRVGGAGCDARDGYSASHAIFGASEHCVAVHPSDLAVGLLALDAAITVESQSGQRTIPMAELLVLPGDTPHVESSLQPDELITTVDISPMPERAKSVYSKVDDHNSYSFAVVSVAAVLVLESKQVTYARLTAGGVAHKPWRLASAEKAVLGKTLDTVTCKEAGEAAIEGAQPLRHNSHKVPLLRDTVEGVLLQLAGGAA